MNFDGIAPFYEASARLVFGNQHRRAEAFFLPKIPENSRVLLVGGGAGHLLASLLSARSPAFVAFVEPSGAMRRRAERRVARLPNAGVVRFLEKDQALERLAPFDALLTPYVLDLFSDETLETRFLPPLMAALSPGAVWLFTDFVPPSRRWQKALLRVMYAFFRLTARIPARHLPDYERQFRRWGFEPTERRRFFGTMIETLRLQRKNA
jgi:SAM-dependent methyltransferase